jgi:phospholipase/carboxylesterase
MALGMGIPDRFVYCNRLGRHIQIQYNLSTSRSEGIMNPAKLSLHHIIRPTQGLDQQPPLLILLHGIGSHEGDLFSLTPYLDERFFIVSARGPITLMPGGYGWYHVEFLPDGMLINAAEEAQSRQTLINFIDEVVTAYDGDPQRIYLMGFSQGAIMSYGIMLTAPQKIAGVVAMSGRLLDEARPAQAPPGLEGFPIIVAHGAYDNVIPVRFAREARAYLETLPVALTYHEYPMAHQISEQSLSDINQWLAERLDGKAQT